MLQKRFAFLSLHDSSTSLPDRKGAGEFNSNSDTWMRLQREVASQILPRLAKRRLHPHHRTIFPVWLSRLHQPVGIGSLVQGKSGVDDGANLSVSEQWPHFLLHGLASEDFSSTDRERRVEPVTSSRFIMMARRSAVTWLPWEVAMCTSRPPVASKVDMLGKVVAADHVEDGVDPVGLGPAGQFRGPVPHAVLAR